MSKRTPGLRKRGQVWHVEKVIPGTGIKLCESTGETELVAAERYLEKRTAELRAVHVYGERQAHTFEEAASRFVLESRVKSFDRYATSLKQAIPFIGHLPLTEIHSTALAPFIEFRLAEGRAAGTLTRDIAAIKQVLNHATQHCHDAKGRAWLDALPLLKAPKGAQRKPRPITQAEQTALFQSLPPYLAEMALFAVHTGLRAQELCGLRWDWEHSLTGTDASVFVIPGEVAKNGKERIVPLNSVARSIIEQRRCAAGTQDFVFSYKGHRVSRPTNKAWNKAKVSCKLEAVRWHDLRHTFGMRLRAAGVPEEDRADLLGHHTRSITTHYSKAQISHLIECVEKLCETEEAEKPEMTLIRRKK